MAFWDQLKSKIADLQSTTKTEVAKHQSKDFAKASMAMCALIAAADGTITAEERRKTASFITSNDALSVFPAADLQGHFEFYPSTPTRSRPCARRATRWAFRPRSSTCSPPPTERAALSAEPL